MDGHLSHSKTDLPTSAAALLNAVRSQHPRVHCITNAAAQVLTANLLLAAGAIPSLTIAAEEISYFAARSSALLVNLGTLDAERRAALPLALKAATERDLPWILDPVFVEVSPPRLALAREMLAHHPTILRCNAPEFHALFGAEPTDSLIKQCAQEQRCIIALTGPVDTVSDGNRLIKIGNGHSFMAQTTAMGCAGAALIGAFAAVQNDFLLAAAAGLLVMGLAGELAAADAKGPGSFIPAFLDRISHISQSDLQCHARVFA